MKKIQKNNPVQPPKITPHICHHTYCSKMANKGINPKTMQYLMGHSDIGITLNIYTHTTLENVFNEVQRAEQIT